MVGATSDDEHRWHPAWWWWDSQPAWCASIIPNGGATTTRASGIPRRGGISISRNGPASIIRNRWGDRQSGRLVSRGMVVAIGAAIGYCRIILNGGAMTGTACGIPRHGGGNFSPTG